MAKANPLFIDSTKMTGDLIGTLIELKDVILYDEETLHVLITNHLGQISHQPMALNEDLNYQSRVWLNHQKNFTYQFVVAKGENRFLESVPKQARAQHAIVDEWVPVLAEPGSVLPNNFDMRPAAPAANTRIPEHAKSVASLLEKFGL